MEILVSSPSSFDSVALGRMWPRRSTDLSTSKQKCREFARCSRRLKASTAAAAAAASSFEEPSSGLPQSLRIFTPEQQLQGGGRPRRPRKLSSSGGEGIVASSMKKAFSSMVHMLKSIQRYTFEMRQMLLVDEVGVHEMWAFVQREMHSSLLWIFQQVFACTPKLMVSVMILLANFTVHSIDSSLDMGLLVPLTTTMVSTRTTPLPSSSSPRTLPTMVVTSELDVDVGGSGSRSSNKNLPVAGGMDGDGDAASSSSLSSSSSMFSQEETSTSTSSSSSPSKDSGLFLHVLPTSSSSGDEFSPEDVMFFKLLLQQAAKEVDGDEAVVSLEADLRKSLVAPVNAELEPDNYECYDRTDLVYQHALSLDSANPLLLANYAQFLYLVRHDHDRAESFFRRASVVDPLDGEVMSRFATFLWLARGDTSEAEQAFKSAIAADPSNPFHVGNYAHFLWNSDDGTQAGHAKQQQMI